MRRGLIYLTFLTVAFPALGQGQLRFTLPSFSSGGGTGNVTGPGAACADNQLARWNGASAVDVQCSVVTAADTTGDLSFPGAVTISTAASNGSITLDPHGTGFILLPTANNAGGLKVGDLAGAATSFYLRYFDSSGTPSMWLADRDGGAANALISGSIMGGSSGQNFKLLSYGAGAEFRVGSSYQFGWSSNLTNAADNAADTGLVRLAAGAVKVTNGSTAGGLLKLGDKGAALPTCDATYEGTIAYDDDENEFCGCNGSAWAPLDGAGTCD